MPTLTGPITPDGALVTLAIGVSESRRHKLQRFNFPVPLPVIARAMIDPGSLFSFGDGQVLPSVGGMPLGQQSLLSSASGLAVHLLPVYLLSVTLLDAVGQPMMYWPHVNVLGTTYDPATVVQGIFGRDLLADCVFHYDGKAGSFSLTV
jgi:hypothetical protein